MIWTTLEFSPARLGGKYDFDHPQERTTKRDHSRGGKEIAGLGVAHAQYPERGLTLIVPYGAGGGTDITARLLARDRSDDGQACDRRE